jgi:hypothetical protein
MFVIEIILAPDPNFPERVFIGQKAFMARWRNQARLGRYYCQARHAWEK